MSERPEVVLSTKIEGLKFACWRQLPLDAQTRFYPGIKLFPNPSDALYKVAGAFAILKTLTPPLSGTVVAHVGFDITEESFVITNSPQGCSRNYLEGYPDDLKTAVLTELRNGFREELLGAVLKIASVFKNTGIRQVKGISAHNDERVDINGGVMPYHQALRSMDELYRKCGFDQDIYGDFVLSLISP